ncbi:hypothetical protein GCM10027051_03480 [Niabella terrae]
MVLGCENSETEINALNRKQVQKDEAIKIEGFLSQGGKVKARLTAALMVRVTADTPYVEFPKKLHVDFYDSTKLVTTRMDSKYGKYYETLNQIYLRDSVKVVTTKGDTLYCEDLWWDQEKELFFTDRPTLYQSATGQRIPGKYGLEAPQDFSSVKFKKVQEGMLQTGDDDLPQ